MYVSRFSFPKVSPELQINERRYKIIGKGGKDIVNIEINGNCCIKIFQSYHQRGVNQFIKPGFNNAPNFSSIRSMKFGLCQCENIEEICDIEF